MPPKGVPSIVRLLLAGFLLAGILTSSSLAGEKKNSDVENIGKRDINKGSWNLWSIEREMALGRSLAQGVERSSRLLEDPIVTEYVNRVAQNLVRNSDAKLPFVIKVIDSDEINAFALPGGFFYVNTGLVLAADNEAELAGVMSHEIAHVAARHATKQATKAQIVNWLSIPLIFIGGPVGYAITQTASLAIPLTFLKFSRNAEREADYLGLEYAYRAGYDPLAFIDFFEKIKKKEKQKKGTIPKAFATHPMTEDRIKRAQEEINRVLPPREDYIIDTSEFQQIQERLKRLQGERMNLSRDGREPTLRRRDTKPGGKKSPTDETQRDSEKDTPPVLKRPKN